MTTPTPRRGLRRFATPLAAAAAVAAPLALSARPAAAQAAGGGIFTIFGNAGQEFVSNWPIILGAITYGAGPLCIILGLIAIYMARKYGTHGGQGLMVGGVTGIVVGCCIIGLVAFGTAGTATFTGGPPTAGSGAAVAF